MLRREDKERHTCVADQDVDVFCQFLDLLRCGVDILDITQIALDKDDSVIAFPKVNSISSSPFLIGGVELVFAPGDDDDLFDAVEK